MVVRELGNARGRQIEASDSVELEHTQSQGDFFLKGSSVLSYLSKQVL
jgi:hypothetical protein